MPPHGWNPTVVLAVAVFLALLISTSWYFWETSLSESRKVRRYFDLLYRVSIVVTVFALLYTVQLSSERDARERDERVVAQLEAAVTDVESRFADPARARQLLPLFAEMHPGFAREGPSGAARRWRGRDGDEDPESRTARRLQEWSVAAVIFRHIEASLALLGPRVSTPGYREWVRTWRQWFRSPTLRRLWELSRDGYSARMQTFVKGRLLPGNVRTEQQYA